MRYLRAAPSALALAPAPALACSPPIPGEMPPPAPTIEQRAEAIVRGSDMIA